MQRAEAGVRSLAEQYLDTTLPRSSLPFSPSPRSWSAAASWSAPPAAGLTPRPTARTSAASRSSPHTSSKRPADALKRARRSAASLAATTSAKPRFRVYPAYMRLTLSGLAHMAGGLSRQPRTGSMRWRVGLVAPNAKLAAGGRRPPVRGALGGPLDDHAGKVATRRARPGRVRHRTQNRPYVAWIVDPPLRCGARPRHVPEARHAAGVERLGGLELPRNADAASRQAVRPGVAVSVARRSRSENPTRAPAYLIGGTGRLASPGSMTKV
jgi:hypothetical protein